MHTRRLFWALAAASVVAGCTTTENVVPPLPPEQARAQAAASFDDALAQLRSRDDTAGWNEAACRQTAADFAGAAKRFAAVGQHDRAANARYNQAITLQRCHLDAEAAKIHAALLDADAGFHRARVQLALIGFAEDRDLNRAIAALSRAVRDSAFKSPEALVQLATLQLQRGDATPDADGSDDFDRANRNLRRALANDDGYMPAYNQLAVLLLEQARRKAGRTTRGLALASDAPDRADTQALELAQLVCSQGLRKDPRYAPLHNTSGLISAELGQLGAAAQAFERARGYDPRLFEAHMNYAAVNMQFRGFANAADAYRAALRIRPDSYDARLGLALALRGQARPEDRARVAQALAELHKAKALDPARAEAYFNEAILVQAFQARGEGAAVLASLKTARSLFEAFLARAEGDPALARARDHARERMSDIDQIVAAMQDTPR